MKNNSTKCFGIISYIPEESKLRTKRIAALEKLLLDLYITGPTVPKIIIAQNGNEYTAPDYLVTNTTIKMYNEPLGILGARNELRKVFLEETTYNFLIMLDDDVELTILNQKVAQEYLDNLIGDGYCIVKNQDGDLGCYTTEIVSGFAHLNLLAISRELYKFMPIPNIDPQKGEGWEDYTFALLLTAQFPEFEIVAPIGLGTKQHRNEFSAEAKSTGTTGKDVNTNPIILQNRKKHSIIEQFINKYACLPDLDILKNTDRAILPKTVVADYKKIQDGKSKHKNE